MGIRWHNETLRERPKPSIIIDGISGGDFQASHECLTLQGTRNDSLKRRGTRIRRHKHSQLRGLDFHNQTVPYDKVLHLRCSTSNTHIRLVSPQFSRPNVTAFHQYCARVILPCHFTMMPMPQKRLEARSRPVDASLPPVSSPAPLRMACLGIQPDLCCSLRTDRTIAPDRSRIQATIQEALDLVGDDGHFSL